MTSAPSKAAPAAPVPDRTPDPPALRRQAARITGALVASGAGLAALSALATIYAVPALVPILVPAVILLAAFGYVGVGRIELARVVADRDRAATENRRLSTALETLADTTWELRESEERQARQKAEAANAAKSRLLATVSHEFRTPLNGILGLTGLLLETRLTPDQETYVRGVHSSGEALLALVDDMLDFSRVEAGRLDLRPEPTDLEGLLQDIVELLAARAYAKGIDIAARMGRDVSAEVVVDRARLRQVLLNLAGNGVKFTEAGGVTVSVERGYSSDPETERVVFSVSDSGPGIPPEDADRIFGEFEQVDTALTRRHGGAGLGLAISRRIVRRMGSDIILDRVPGQGAIFRFTLDVKPVNDHFPALPAELYGRRVLVVAPDGAEPPVLAQNLGDGQVSARIVASANEAAALAGAAMAASMPYHAVLIDQRISPDPGKALERIRGGAGTRLPAAILIEPGKRGEIEALRGNGFDAYLVRPVRRSSLFRIVGEIMTTTGGFHTDPSDARPVSPDTRQRAQRSLDILLAEDNEINALLVRAVLEGLGHSVTEVRDGQAAVAAATAADAHFGVVFMDLHMPRLDGMTAARLIRAHEFIRRRPGGKVVIIALTADVLPETRAEAEAAGIDAVLAKPIAPDSLRRVLAEAAA